MATNIDVTLKRYNGTDYDNILPTTHLGQIYTDSTLTTSLTTYLNNTYIPLSQRAAANGVATLDANTKIPYAQLPDALFGGLKFVASLSANTDLDSLGAAFTNETDAQGSYWIATANIDLTSTANSTVLAPGDEGDSTFPITIEAGDWVLITSWATNDYTFAIINNTYQDATDAAKGIVTLSSETDTTGTTSKVITEGVLEALVVADNANLNGTTNTNLLAPAAHHHDGLYYTETEVQGFFAGTTSITGYNKANWDTAYGDKVDAVAFNTADGVLTLTRQDSGTLTVDLDGRYVEDIQLAQVDSTAGLTIAQTGDVYTLGHADTSSQASVDNANGTIIQDITLDTYGHITAIGSVDLDGRYYTETELDAGQLDNRYYTETELDAGQLDNRYYTETEIDNWIDGSGTINGNTYVPILYGAAPTSSITGALIIDID